MGNTVTHIRLSEREQLAFIVNVVSRLIRLGVESQKVLDAVEVAIRDEFSGATDEA